MKDEEIVNLFNGLDKRIEKLERLFEQGSPKKMNNDFESKLISKIDKIPIQHLVIIALKLKSEQTRIQLKQTLEEWGKVVGDWFGGGNMTNRLIKENIVNIVRQNEERKDVYKLSKKGELLAEDLMTKIEIE